MSEQAVPRISPEAYLAIDRAGEFKSEYHGGEMFAMSGGSLAHSMLPALLSAALVPQLQSRGCMVASSDLRIQISPRGPFVYPDLTVFCGKPILADEYKDTLLNPMVVFEIFSKSSEGCDRGHKFAQYRRVDSLRDYVLVSQDEARIEVFSRVQGGKWALSEAVGLDARCTLPGIDCQLNLSDIYRDISFPTENAASA